MDSGWRAHHGKRWSRHKVSNWRTGIDVDKFDYFRRDAQHLGIQRQWDHMRYIKHLGTAEISKACSRIGIK